MKYNTKRKRKARLRNLFRSTSPQVEEGHTKISFSALKKLASTNEQKDILKRIEQETIPTVRNAWIDYFLEKTKQSKYKSD